MRGVRGLVAVIVMAAAQCGSGLAAAETISDGRDGSSFLLFAGTDLWRHGVFLHGGLLWSPQGDREGLLFKAVISGGAYRAGTFGNAQVTGRELGVVVTPGWKFKQGPLEIKLFAGLDLRDYRLSPDDPSAGLRGSHVGAQGAVDLWYEPTPATMVAADASISSIGKNASARAAFGWRFLDLFYLGPEAQTFACNDYRQYRLGLHATAFKTEAVELSGAVGWATDSDRRTGAYGRVGLLARQ
jgi:hypothetical protein